jgi:hypothetical protein
MIAKAMTLQLQALHYADKTRSLQLLEELLYVSCKR